MLTSLSFPLLLLALSAFTPTNASKSVTNISDCPKLTPRNGTNSVHDLRIDDIKVVGALGDSITAGFGILGYDATLPPLLGLLDSYNEYRGLSYSIGGDEKAYTVPNYIKHFQPRLNGYSTGKHIGEYCNADNCAANYLPDQDELNAAQSGAIAMNLDHELDYLIKQMRNMKNIDFDKDWKMINIQIGSNDMCGACNTSYSDEVTPDKFGNYVEKVIERIERNIPRVLINLIGTFNVSEVFPLTANHPEYCHNQNATNGKEHHSCACSATPEGLATLYNLSAAYNERLYSIYKKYQKTKKDDFAVVYQQSNINISGFPLDFFRYNKLFFGN
ncbi:hypothetical protein BDF20DRAFT_827354 [Mycotypha africana]|uniref:uncharacterized protein n=1 Tax=Mycotypha africana TaxID=64632 RepID=UPI00230176DE|nr:uncharacterized protein BDF20DRAFT_827354 [Mycotypha africana]KAI8969081.1 hypothetical protein BDF20DRAFT_827354 [Mycotypha africana]